uniref:Uncharacterized protein n=1 Tax=Arundo donax TaxID=35708 RepID=A0A0A9E2U5_ARUDO
MLLLATPYNYYALHIYLCSTYNYIISLRRSCRITFTPNGKSGLHQHQRINLPCTIYVLYIISSLLNLMIILKLYHICTLNLL